MDTEKNQDEVMEEQTGTDAPAEAPVDVPAPQPETATPVDNAQAAADSLAVTQIQFPNKNQAKLVAPPPDTDAAIVVNALGLGIPETVLVMIGDAVGLDENRQAHLIQLFSRGLARSAAEMDTVIIDNGRNAGTSTVVGQGVADRGRKSTLLSVVSADTVTYPGDLQTGVKGKSQLDPNHSHFILTPGDDAANETEMALNVALYLAKPKSIVAIVVGGGDAAKKQVLQSVRNNLPVIVIKETGGLAENIANKWQERFSFIPDPDMAEIVADGKLFFVQLTSPIEVFERLLGQLSSVKETLDETSTLEVVWQRFALCDQAANRQQKVFVRMQFWILFLGVFGTLLAIIQTTTNLYYPIPMIDRALHYVLLLIPVSVAVLIAAANRFSSGNKWILLRATAETLKKEIYRYRTRVEIYSDQQTRKTSREIKLYRKEEALGRKLMQTEVNLSSLKPYDGPIPPLYGAGPGDDGLSFLSPDRYMAYRLDDQLVFYQNKTVKLEKQMQRLQWAVYIFGGLGTVLVAIGQEIWIAFTLAMVAAFTTYIEYRQIENTLMRYNQTANELAGIRSWWIALSPEEQADPKNIDKLVGQTEASIHSEHATWVQDMQDALAELRAEQSEENQGGGGDAVTEQEQAVIQH